MVALKPTKTAKHTYAERVLQAFSQVRKNHRRHTVHLATLRAQVKKNAEAQRDKLGPQWPSWVTKAVHRLENEGILAAGSSGSITVTAAGKKSIVSARKSLSIPATAAAQSAAQEEGIVTHSPATPSVRGLKRPRHSATQTPREDLGDDEWQPSSSSRAKRARPSISPSKKSVSRMTKAELKVALQTLETQHANLLMRATSPLTDIDGEEERERLRSELKARDEELERIRRQLDETTAQTDTDRPSSPDYHRNMSSPPVEHRRPSSSVIRTQSGSLIHDVSKQPTPAPSSPGAHWEGDEGSFGGMDDEDPVSINRIERHRPVTPAGTAITNQDRDTDLAAEISHLKGLMDKMRRQNEKREHVDGEKVSVLEKTLATRIAELQKHKELHAELSGQVSQLEGQIADRDFRVSGLEQEIETLRSSLSSASLELVTKDTELKNIHVSMEASLARLHELEQTAGQHEEAMASLSAEKANYLEQLDTAQRQLQQAEEALTKYSKRITLSEEEAKHLKADLQRSQLELSEKENLAQLLQAEFQVHKTSVSNLREAAARREGEFASLTRQLEEALSQQTLLVEQCTSKEAQLTSSQASLVALQTRAAGFDLTLAERDSKVAELTERLANVRTESHSLRDKIISLELTIGKLREELDSTASSHAELDLAYQLKSNECSDLSVRLQEVEGNVVTLNGALSKAKDDAAAASQRLEQARDGENAWRDSLRRAEAAHEKLAESLAAEVEQLREKLSTSELKANEYIQKSSENQFEIAGLREQVTGAQGRIQEAEKALRVAKARHSAERATHESTVTAMEESLAATRREIDSLSLEMRSVRTAHGKLQGELDVRTEELSDVRESLHAESQRATSLEAELAAAISNASDAEEGILDLRSSKQADERTIDFLRESYAKLREVQMQSLAELDDKVHSAHSTPVSKIRRNPRPQV